MNRYPSWLNVLVLGILLLGMLLALPNIYGSVSAIQLAEIDGKPFDDARIERVVQVLDSAGITTDDAYLQDGRVVVTFAAVEDQLVAGDLLRERFASDSNVAITLAPRLPAAFLAR
jgi:preprotein translocase subunit SecD